MNNVMGGELVLEFIDNKATLQKVNFFSITKTYVIESSRSAMRIPEDDVFKLTQSIVKRGVKKITKCNPKYFKSLSSVSYSAIAGGNLEYLPIFVKLQNFGISNKTYICGEEKVAIQKYLERFDRGVTLVENSFGECKIKNRRNKKEMAVSTYIKKHNRSVSRMSALLRSGMSLGDVVNLARIIDRNGENISV